MEFLLKELAVTGADAARKLYGAEGYVCHHNTDLWRFAWPLMKGAAEFLLDLLVSGPDGKLIPAPSTSPENCFQYEGESCSLDRTSTMSLAITRELFRN